MNTPTKEQIDAAKAYVRHAETPMQYALLRGRDTAIPPGRVAAILLAALEAAEQDTARLDWLQAISHWQWPAFRKWDGKILLDDIGFPSECDRIAEGSNVRDALDAARKEART